MIKVKLEEEEYAVGYGLWQYDFGQILELEGLENRNEAVRVDFSYEKKGKFAIKSELGVWNGDKLHVMIPDILLINNFTDENYKIYAFVYALFSESGETVKRIRLPVTSRPVPVDIQAVRLEANGYYMPKVDIYGNITWTGSSPELPEIPVANIKGPKGDLGGVQMYPGKLPEHPVLPCIYIDEGEEV